MSFLPPLKIMNTVAIALVIVSSIMHAVRDLYTKKSYDKHVFLWWFVVTGTIMFSPLFIYSIWKEGIPDAKGFMILAGASFIHLTYWILLAKCYEHGDLSHVYPIIRSAPALVLIFSVVILKENVSIFGALGVLFIVVGTYAINLTTFKIRGWLKPFQLARKDGITRIAFLTVFFVAGYTIIDKIGVSNVEPLSYLLFLDIIVLTLYTIYIAKTKSMDSIKNEWRKNKNSIMLNGILGKLGYLLMLIAFTRERVSYLVSLRQLSVVIAVILGGHILKEKNFGIRATASAMIFIGAILIANGG